MNIKRLIAGLAVTPLVAALAMPLTAFAATTNVVVTPTNTQGWSTADTKNTGSVTYTNQYGAPTNFGLSSLKLNTPDGNDKAQYAHAANNVLLSGVNDISYYAYRSSASATIPGQAPAVNLTIDFNGAATGGFATLVYEPIYQTGGAAAVHNDEWQKWTGDDSSIWWSTKTMPGVSNSFTSYVSLGDIKAANPDATITDIRVNQGSGNGGLVSGVDAVTFNGTTYNFEAVTAPTITAPANNSSVYSSDLTKIDWSDSEGLGVIYTYEAYSDATYTAQVYATSGLPSSEIATPNTPAGEYYVRVAATDANGNTSQWSNGASNPYHITVKADLTYPADKDACKNDGWKTFTGKTFKNQGDCVSYVAAGGHKQNNKPAETVSFSSVKF
jgi:hypothetical protein